MKPANGGIAIILGVAGAGLVHGLVRFDNPLINILLAGGVGGLVAVLVVAILGKRGGERKS